MTINKLCLFSTTIMVIVFLVTTSFDKNPPSLISVIGISIGVISLGYWAIIGAKSKEDENV